MARAAAVLSGVARRWDNLRLCFMDRKHVGQELGRLARVVEDARRRSMIRWRQGLTILAAAPLALRLAVHQGAVREEVRDAFPGLDMIQDPYLVLIILLGVVDAGEDVERVEAVTGITLR